LLAVQGTIKLGNVLTRVVSAISKMPRLKNSIDQVLVEMIDAFLRYGTRKDYSFVPPNSGDTIVTKEEIRHG
jgi:hypothetical protein